MSEYTTQTSTLQQDAENNLNCPTFEQYPHDAEHPYVIINRDLTRNALISFEARGFLYYLLSHSKGWVINRSYIIRSQNIKEHSLKKIIDELIHIGHVKMERYVAEKGYRRVKYLVSEYPRFKEKIPHREIPSEEIPDGEKHGTKEVTKESKDSYKEVKKEYKEWSADASDIFIYFLKKLKERTPKMKEPDRNKWTEAIDTLMRVDKRSKEDVIEAVDWVEHSTNSWYRKAVRSPETLRKYFDQIIADKQESIPEQNRAKNRKWALEVKDKYPDQLKKMNFDRYGVTNSSNGKDVSFSMNHEKFKELFIHIFGGEK